MTRPATRPRPRERFCQQCGGPLVTKVWRLYRPSRFDYAAEVTAVDVQPYCFFALESGCRR